MSLSLSPLKGGNEGCLFPSLTFFMASRPRGRLNPHPQPEPVVGGYMADPSASGWGETSFISRGQGPMEGLQKPSEVNELVSDWEIHPLADHTLLSQEPHLPHAGLTWNLTLVY